MRKVEIEFTIREVIQMMLDKAVQDGSAEAGKSYSTDLKISHDQLDHSKSRIYLVLSAAKPEHSSQAA